MLTTGNFRQPDRLAAIAAARRSLLDGDRSVPATADRLEGWIERSWRRCLAQGHEPTRRVVFEPISAASLRRTAEDSRPLIEAARPTLVRVSRAIASTRYFAMLTDAAGVVVDTHGSIDRNDPRVSMLARVGVDLSERAVGTTAIGAALAELSPVWLHRGEHFFDDTSVYSCAGAPLIGPAGGCVGMLDLTGVDVPERPELRHLAAESARSIENALVLAVPHALALRINWPGHPLGSDGDGLLMLDEDGCVTGMNSVARQLLPLPVPGQSAGLHCSDLFAMPWTMLFDAARSNRGAHDVPLWSGLRMAVHAMRQDAVRSLDDGRDDTHHVPLRDVESALIRKTVDDARGNVTEAARLLGISRATVYRKLARPAR